MEQSDEYFPLIPMMLFLTKALRNTNFDRGGMSTTATPEVDIIKLTN
jgi:hypothetical protein